MTRVGSQRYRKNKDSVSCWTLWREY